jgi:hypothetical protein
LNRPRPTQGCRVNRRRRRRREERKQGREADEERGENLYEEE